MAKLYEGPAEDLASTKKTPSGSAITNGEPGMEKRSPTSTGVPEVTYTDYGVLPSPSKGS